MIKLTGFHYFIIVWLLVALFIGVFIDSEVVLVKDPTKYDPKVEIWPPEVIAFQNSIFSTFLSKSTPFLKNGWK